MVEGGSWEYNDGSEATTLGGLNLPQILHRLENVETSIDAPC